MILWNPFGFFRLLPSGSSADSFILKERLQSSLNGFIDSLRSFNGLSQVLNDIFRFLQDPSGSIRCHKVP